MSAPDTAVIAGATRPATLDTESPRLYALVARTARTAVVFRRGPSRRTQMLLWHLDSDTLTAGQWFKGRVYERRCDLSADGTMIALFCASFRGPRFSWTALARPPYFTALASWPKGDCWGGGALIDDKTIRLNHPHADAGAAPLPSGPLPRRFKLEPLHAGAGRGEDDPIRVMRMERDGWRWQNGKPGEHIRQERSGLFHYFDKPFVTRRPLHRHIDVDAEAPALQVQHHAIGENQGRWYVETAQIVGSTGDIVCNIGRVDFADVDHTGDVLYGRNGCLYRLPHAAAQRDYTAQPQMIADLNSARFSNVSCPPEAKRWANA